MTKEMKQVTTNLKKFAKCRLIMLTLLQAIDNKNLNTSEHNSDSPLYIYMTVLLQTKRRAVN